MLSSSVLSKECRLCGVSDGPFVNIFGAMGLAGKIKILLPMLVIDEWDDLSHKTCYRCTAKVAEFHEFADKCIDTQKSLFKKLGKKSIKCSERTKKTREDWEKTLADKNISNDQYCDELVKKALESLSTFKGEDMKEDEPLKPKKTPLKDLKIVLTKFEKPNLVKELPKEALLKTNLRNKSSRNSQESLPQDVKNDEKDNTIDNKDEKKPEELSDNITFFDVTDVDSIYSCKTCNRIFVQKDKIKNHKCSQVDINDKAKVDIEQISQKDLPSTSKTNVLPIPNVMNNTQQLPYLVKTLDNNLIVLPPNYLQCNQNVLNMIPQNMLNLNANILKTSTEVPLNQEEEDMSISVLSEKMKSVKNKLKKDNKAEPYPVGLFYRKSQENAELATSKSVSVKDKPIVEMDKNKKYKIKPNDQPGKIIIATVDRKECLEEDSPLVDKRISHKKQKKNHKKRGTSAKQINETANNDMSKSTENGDYFTFLNIDPILLGDPSYVLPTTNTVQESQVSTTDINSHSDKLKKKGKNKQTHEQNTCNICDLVFNDITLFINHIQTHFDDPPQESSKPVEVKRRGRKRKNPI